MISPEPSFSKNSTPPEITRLLQQELIWFAPLQLEIVSEDNKKIICFEWPQLASTSSFSSTIEKLLPGLKESYREKIRLILLHSTDPVVQINENAMEFIRWECYPIQDLPYIVVFKENDSFSIKAGKINKKHLEDTFSRNPTEVSPIN